MAKVTVGVPQGTRDFGPDVVRKRNYIFNTIRSVFELYGFEPLETPAMENLDTLMGKYGEEGDKLIYRILESGDSFSASLFEKLGRYLKEKYELIKHYKENVPGFENLENPFANPLWKFNPEVLEFMSEELRTEEFTNGFKQIKEDNLPKFKFAVSEKALKYDLTIPFARYVAMNHNKLTFPYKRYQIQPVWRADRPQKGRYREFYQCDADVVGSNSRSNEVEFVNIYLTVFEKLGIKAIVKINNRKILLGIAEAIDAPDKMIDIAIAIDKYDKIGKDGVIEELESKGFNSTQIKAIYEIILLHANKIGYTDKAQMGDTNLNKLNFLRNGADVKDSKNVKEGINELQTLIENLNTLGFDDRKIEFDITLARGLNYYTGIIFEVVCKESSLKSSIGGGGRYDDLTGLFGVPNIPGVGISFGVDRIYDVMEELKLFPVDVHTGTQVLFFNLGEQESKAALSIMQQLRNNTIRCELYHEPVKFDKQFKYAEKKNIPYVIIMGSKELEEKTCVIKDIRKGEQQTVPLGKLGEFSFL